MARISSHGLFRKLSFVPARVPYILTVGRYHQSSSCAVRSSVSCYNLAHKFEFDAKLLKKGENEIILSLPFNGTNYEPAILPNSVYVQYDALRLEID
jgi:rhamnogalacturonan endolyase